MHDRAVVGPLEDAQDELRREREQVVRHLRAQSTVVSRLFRSPFTSSPDSFSPVSEPVCEAVSAESGHEPLKGGAVQEIVEQPPRALTALQSLPPIGADAPGPRQHVSWWFIFLTVFFLSLSGCTVTWHVVRKAIMARKMDVESEI